jgi:hypothetical protein
MASMMIWRRLRGLLGNIATWAGVGAVLGLLIFVVRYDAWRLPTANADQIRRWLRLFVSWELAASLWGALGGITFSVAVWLGARTNDIHRLSSRRMAIWGAFAGATLPAGLYVVRLLKGASPYFPTLWIVASLSAIAGAGVGAIVYRLLRRALARDGSVPNPLLSEGMPNDILSPSRAHDRAL